MGRPPAAQSRHRISAMISMEALMTAHTMPAAGADASFRRHYRRPERLPHIADAVASGGLLSLRLHSRHSASRRAHDACFMLQEKLLMRRHGQICRPCAFFIWSIVIFPVIQSPTDDCQRHSIISSRVMPAELKRHRQRAIISSLLGTDSASSRRAAAPLVPPMPGTIA